MSEPRYVMTVDTKRCVGCQACVIACKTENRVPEHHFRDWIVEELAGESPALRLELRSERCNHCTNPPCVDACPTGASHVGIGGTVLVNYDKCTGCKACISACPYDSRFVHPKGYIDKCTFCLHRVTQGQKPACVSVCPTYALTFGDRADPQSEASQNLASRNHKRLHPETGCDPNLYFLV